MQRPPLARTLPAILSLALLFMQGCALMAPPQKEKAPVAQAPSAPCIVLALPTTGPYGAITGRIRRGAEKATKDLAAKNVATQVEFINSAAPDWTGLLAALPPQCQVVGTPLQPKDYAQVKKAGLLQQRTFFIFLPDLEQGDEGALAWRFFPGLQDQIDALIAFAGDSLGINTFGAFAPSDPYGTLMTALFEQSLARRNTTLQKAFYNPADSTTWSTAVTPLINPTVPESGKTVVPRTAFEALFLPDSWKSMDTIVTSLLYNGEDRLVLLGTALWEQGLAGKVLPSTEKFALAVYPVAWNPQTGTARLPGGDFWTALGYDFIVFAREMGLSSRLAAADVTRAAQRAAPKIAGIAPITWDDGGKGHQKMYIFRIAPTGPAPVDPTAFKQTREAIIKRATLRIQGLPPVDSEGNPLTPDPLGQTSPGTITHTDGAIMHQAPRPSYKLRLPAGR
ncbi:MAG: hypothetical protein LBR22_09575 [Desulfovibrio sp.]|nr:hypothetical protein [Desulfovibrio sp.]